MAEYLRNRPGRWRARIRDENGKRVSRSFKEKRDALEFEAHMRRIRDRVRAGLERPVTPVLFFDFVGPWLSTRLKELPPSTTNGEESKLRRIWVPIFANTPLHLVTQSRVEEELRSLMKGENAIGPATRNRHRALLHTIFEDAKTQGLIAVNPISSIPILEEPKSTATPKWKRAEDVDLYLKQAKKEGPIWETLFVVLAWTGLRISEAIALKWHDILWTPQTIVVRRIWESATGNIVERTKGKKNYTRPLLAMVDLALRGWWERTSAKAPDDFIFFMPGERELMTYWKAENMHWKILDHVNEARAKEDKPALPRVTIHGFRHFYVSQLRRVGFRKADIKDIVGHASVKTTEGYMHDLPDMRPVVRRAERLGLQGAKEAVQ